MDRHFNPRSPCGERPAPTGPRGRAERFQSTLSLRRATPWLRLAARSTPISIHALLAESDHSLNPPEVIQLISIHALLAESDFWLISRTRSILHNFNPRSPCGERHIEVDDARGVNPFQSTLSLRRATTLVTLSTLQIFISIHALLAESDLRGDSMQRENIPISIHALLAESDQETDNKW